MSDNRPETKEEADEEHEEEEKKKKKRQHPRIHVRKLSKATKHLILLPFKKFKRKKRSSGGGGGGGCGGGGGSGSGKLCNLCFMSPITTDSGFNSQPEDPNSKEFTYGFVKSFIEKNDFYSKQCNVHLDP